MLNIDPLFVLSPEEQKLMPNLKFLIKEFAEKMKKSNIKILLVEYPHNYRYKE